MMIRVASLDDHAVVRAGIEAMLAPEPDLVFVGGAADEGELATLLYRTRPSVVIVDLDHDGQDGVALGLRLERDPVAVRVVVLSGRTGGDLTVAARVAGADAVVSKRDQRRVLLEAIRATPGGPAAPQEVPAALRARAARRLEPTDRAILAMRLARTPLADIAATVGLRAEAMTARLAAIVTRLVTSDDEGGPPPASPRAVPTLGHAGGRRGSGRRPATVPAFALASWTP